MRIARRLSLFAVLAATIWSIGCHRPGLGGGPSPSYPVPLFIENHGYLDVAVYAMRTSSGPHTRIGTVTGLSKARVIVPATELQTGGSLMLYLHAIGSARSWVSPAVLVSSDDAAVLEIYADPDGGLSRSTLYTRAIDDSSSTDR